MTALQEISDTMKAPARTFCQALLACLMALCSALHAQPQDSPSADNVKAAYLFHFSGYVEWPAETPADVITIGVIGNADVAADLKRILPGRTIQERSLQVREMGVADNLSGIQILYVGREHTASLPALAEKAKEQHLLLVSDTEAGLNQGAAINFVMTSRRVRFEISLRATDEAGIKLSSRLLSAAVRLKRSFWMPKRALALSLPPGGWQQQLKG